MKKTNSNSVLKIISAFFIICSFLCCAKSADSGAAAANPTPVTATPTDGSQTAAQLAGTGLFCATDATLGGTFGYTHNLTLGADGSYTYSVFFSDAATCADAQHTSGTNMATYTQTGTFTVGGTASTPSTGTKITFTVTSALMTIRPATNVPAQNLATWMNTHCSPNPGFLTGATSTKSLSANNCTTSGSFLAVTIPAVTDAFSNTVYNTGSALDAGIGSGQDLWRPGGSVSSFPASYSQTYLSWQ